MNKRTNIGLLLLVFVVGIAAVVGFAFAGYKADQEMAAVTYVLPPVVKTTSPAGQVAGVAIERAVVNIYRGTGTTLSAQVNVEEGGTVQDALQAATDAFGLKLDITDSQYGKYVNGIGDLLGGQDNQYWMYYVNGKSGTVAVDKQAVAAGDTIDFKFEKSNL